MLRCKTQVVTGNKIQFSPSPLTCGVTLGSVQVQILFILYTQPLSGVISHHSVSHHTVVDDTELYKSDSLSKAFTLAPTTESCTSDVMVWIVQSKPVKWWQNRDKWWENRDSSDRLLELIFLLHYVSEWRLIFQCSSKPWWHFWRPVCTEGTGEQTLSTCLTGNQADHFNPTVSFFWSHQNSFLSLVPPRLVDCCNALLAGSLQVFLHRIK